MVNLVEKAGFGKIQKLEISERERHHEILLTVKNLRDLSRSPSPYTLPIIPRPLPTKVVEGEYYVIANLPTLILSSSSPAQASETKSKQSSLAREDPDVAPRAFKEVDRGNRPKGLPFTKKGFCLDPQVSKKGRRASEQRRPLGMGVEDFVPWVAPISSLPPASEEEEEEDEMADLIHNFSAWKHKRGARFNRTADVTSKAIGVAGQHSAGGGSGEQAIVVMDSLEMGFHSQPAVETAHLSDLEEVPPSHEEARGDIPSEHTASRPS